uniref:Uncharacterized protein n=1 Tax=Cucumis melo TaxID=3656 RepID=A0A9I9E3H5_CUCME
MTRKGRVAACGWWLRRTSGEATHTDGDGEDGDGAETDTKMEGERRLRRRADETKKKVEGARAVAR